MFRIMRVPAVLDKFFDPLRSHFHWNHGMYFRLLVVAMAFMWGRRHVANLYRYLDVEHHRTRFNNFFLVERWDPEAALRQKAQELLRALRPGKGETIYLIIDDSKNAKRGKAMDAIAKMEDPTTEAYIRGHQYVCAILVYRDCVIPWGIRLYVKKAQCTTVGVPFHKTTELAADLIREFQPPTGVKVVVLFDAYDLCPTVVKVCRAQQFHFASTLKSHRSLFKQGWKLTAGRYGRNLCRRRRTNTLDLVKPYGPVRYRFVDAGWLEVSTLGPLRVVFSRKGTAKKILGLVTDAPELAAADLIRTYDKRWTIEVLVQDWKSHEGWSQLTKQPGKEGARRRVILSLLVDHGLFYHPDAHAQFKRHVPASTVGSLRAQLQVECLVHLIETLMSSDAPQAHLLRFTHAIHEAFAFGLSKKHMIQRP